VKKKSEKNNEKMQKRERRKALWITVVIHSDLGVGER
jgi:hypothetical protein